MKVKDPQGRTWRVTRRWVPWRRRLKGWMDSAPDLPTLGDDPISLVIGLVLLVLLIPLVVVAVVAALELLLLLLLLPLALLVRVAFGRHWTIEARRGFTIHWDGSGGTWRESGSAIEALARRIEHGQLPTTTVHETGPPDVPGFY